MKDLCTHFQEGKCRFGSSCKKRHITVCPLLDPPIWIFSNVSDIPLNLHVVSAEEIRYSLRFNDTRRILDDMWIDNYTQMYRYMNGVCKKGPVMSTSKRCIDLRKNPECFNLPFDLSYVEERIIKLREECPIIECIEMLEGENDGSVDDIDVENAPSFVKEYAYKKEADESSRDYNDKSRGDYNSGRGDYNSGRRDYNSGRGDYNDNSRREYNNKEYGDNRNYNNREFNNKNYNNRNYDNREFHNKDREFNNRNFNNDNRDSNNDNRFNRNYNNKERDFNNDNRDFNNRERDFNNRERDFNNKDRNFNNKDRNFTNRERDFNRNPPQRDNFDTRPNPRDWNKGYDNRNRDNYNKGNTYNNKDTDRERYPRGSQDGRPLDNRRYNEDQSNFDKDRVNKREDDGRDYEYKNIPYDHREK